MAVTARNPQYRLTTYSEGLDYGGFGVKPDDAARRVVPYYGLTDAEADLEAMASAKVGDAHPQNAGLICFRATARALGPDWGVLVEDYRQVDVSVPVGNLPAPFIRAEPWSESVWIPVSDSAAYSSGYPAARDTNGEVAWFEAVRVGRRVQLLEETTGAINLWNSTHGQVNDASWYGCPIGHVLYQGPSLYGHKITSSTTYQRLWHSYIIARWSTAALASENPWISFALQPDDTVTVTDYPSGTIPTPA